jgi:drug/metabolite transporter (DMT)-like permease
MVLAAALLPAGMLGDRFGRKRMLPGALVVFGAASVAWAYAASTGQLITARVALGIGAAVLMPLTSAVPTVLFDDAERPRALTVWVTASALGIPGHGGERRSPGEPAGAEQARCSAPYSPCSSCPPTRRGRRRIGRRPWQNRR